MKKYLIVCIFFCFYSQVSFANEWGRVRNLEAVFSEPEYNFFFVLKEIYPYFEVINQRGYIGVPFGKSKDFVDFGVVHPDYTDKVIYKEKGITYDLTRKHEGLFMLSGASRAFYEKEEVKHFVYTSWPTAIYRDNDSFLVIKSAFEQTAYNNNGDSLGTPYYFVTEEKEVIYEKFGQKVISLEAQWLKGKPVVAVAKTKQAADYISVKLKKMFDKIHNDKSFKRINSGGLAVYFDCKLCPNSFHVGRLVHNAMAP